ncbi:hypothetical protein JXB31_04265 [Candidatus Woesearchaeota archaeon]|nr:hypothetical protein [Candidatus Woesearchaeota archaeon]
MDRRILSLIVLVFILGWFTKGVCSYIAKDMAYYEWDSESDELKVTGFASALSEAVLKERSSPQDRIKESQIHVYDDRVIIEIDDPRWSTFTDTNSMDPVIDAGANAIHIVPSKESDIIVGDIVAYESEYADGTLIHRVIEIGEDEQGLYYIMKGDNSPKPDPGKVRFSQIRRVLVAVIY